LLSGGSGRGLPGPRAHEQRDVMRIAEAAFKEGEVVGIERQTLSGLAAEEAGDGRAARRALFDGALEAAHIRIAQAIQRATAVVAGD
jgi:hypothetical protein